MDKPQRVGFWRSTTEPDLPMPVAQDTPEEGQGPFLASLRRVEVNLERLNKAERYRGISRCRICGQGNGCAEFTHRGFVWPSGFSHYVAVHNVKVPVDFRDMVFTAAVEDFSSGLKAFWISWVQTKGHGTFELHSPWWYSGTTENGSTVCAAVRAEDEDAARICVYESYDKTPFSLEWRFVDPKPDSWSPFSERFPRGPWMKW
jgi:hypothetical protein